MSRRRIPIGLSMATPEGFDRYMEKLRAESAKKITKQQLQHDLIMLVACDSLGGRIPIHCFNAGLREHLIGQKLAKEADKQRIQLTPKGKALAAQVRQTACILFQLGGLKP